jgi:hypothetical protein
MYSITSKKTDSKQSRLIIRETEFTHLEISSNLRNVFILKFNNLNGKEE